jgi:glycine/D-amino acid oxidase-like deaminating enzyme
MTSVIVVGAGLLGSAVAHHLARAGGEVEVVEAHRPAGGTSGASFAWVNAQDKSPAHYFALNDAGIREYETLVGSLGADWHHPGGDIVIARGERIAALGERIDRHAALGYPVRTLDRASLAALEPGIAPGDGELLVAHFHTEAWIDVPLLVGRLLNDARGHGARVRSSAAVDGFEIDAGRLTGVRLATGEILRADLVLLAAGPSTEQLAGLAGVALPMAPTPGLLAISEPVASGIRHVVHAGDVALRPDGGGRLMLSSRSVDLTLDLGTRQLAIDAEPVREILARAARVVPALAGARLESVRIGVRAVPADGQPAVGFAPGLENCYLLASHSGVTLGALLGRLVASELLGAAEAQLEPYRPARFPAPAA